MKLYEYEGKKIFHDNGITIPYGKVAQTPEEAIYLAEEVGYPAIVKSQVLHGGRKKAGKIHVVENKDQLNDVIRKLFAGSLGSEYKNKVLIEQALDISQEVYAGITLDHRNSVPMLLFSLHGGIDIEMLADNHPERLIQKHLDPNKIYHLYNIFSFINHINTTSKVKKELAQCILKLIKIYFKYDCITAEINPLCITKNNDVYAADSKMELDDSALFRLEHIQSFESRESGLSSLELEAKRKDIAFISLEQGDIGLIAGGAGLGMATMDMVAHFGGQPSNFLDLGGNATQEKTATALKLVLKSPQIKGVLINVFGGINNCEEMAKGIAEVCDSWKPRQKIVVKMRGHSQEEGWRLLEERNISLIKYGTTSDAVKKLMDSMK